MLLKYNIKKINQIGGTSLDQINLFESFKNKLEAKPVEKLKAQFNGIINDDKYEKDQNDPNAEIKAKFNDIYDLFTEDILMFDHIPGDKIDTNMQKTLNDYYTSKDNFEKFNEIGEIVINFILENNDKTNDWSFNTKKNDILFSYIKELLIFVSYICLQFEINIELLKNMLEKYKSFVSRIRNFNKKKSSTYIIPTGPLFSDNGFQD